MDITATAPIWPTLSLANPISIGNMVPPNKPIIIRPETSFLFSGSAKSAWENIIENTLEFPKPISAMQAYIMVLVWKTDSPIMAASKNRTLTRKNGLGFTTLRRKEPERQPIVLRMK